MRCNISQVRQGCHQLLMFPDGNECICGCGFRALRAAFHAEIFSLAYWWAVFLAFGERMRSLTSVLQSIALNLHVFD